METADVRPALARWLVPQFRRLVRLAGVESCELTLRVVDDVQMSLMHERFSGVAGTTDVLTFDLRESPPAADEPAEPLEGDILICLHEAARQAAVRGHPVRLEALLYALHGLLHLQGFDDHTPRGHRLMHRREDELLKAAGLGAVFHRPPRGTHKS